MRLSRQATFLLSLEDAFDLGRMTKRHLGNREPAERDASASDEISGLVATKRLEDPVVGRCPRDAIRGAIQPTLQRIWEDNADHVACCRTIDDSAAP